VARAAIKAMAVVGLAVVEEAAAVATAASVKGVVSAPGPAGTKVAMAAKAP